MNASDMILEEQLALFVKYWKTSDVLEIKNKGRSYYLHKEKFCKYLEEGKVLEGGDIKLVTKDYKEAYMFPLDFVVQEMMGRLRLDTKAPGDK